MGAAGLAVDRVVPVDGVLREWVIVFEPMRWAKRFVGRRYVRSVYNAIDTLLARARFFPSALCVHARPDPARRDR